MGFVWAVRRSLRLLTLLTLMASALCSGQTLAAQEITAPRATIADSVADTQPEALVAAPAFKAGSAISHELAPVFKAGSAATRGLTPVFEGPAFEVPVFEGGSTLTPAPAAILTGVIRGSAFSFTATLPLA